MPWLGSARDLAYPPTCPACFRPARLDGPEEILCDGCTEELREIRPPFCRQCCEPFFGELDSEFRCTNCRDRALAFEFAVSRYRSLGPTREIVHRLKYLRQRWLRLPLGRMAAQALGKDERIGDLEDVFLIPVPVHPRRRRERGFNQAAEIAHVAGQILEVPVIDCLVRHHPTSPQAHLGRKERLENLKGAFGFTRSRHRERHLRALDGRTAILVDDVLTTGATAHHAALAIAEAAAPSRILVVAATRA